MCFENDDYTEFRDEKIVTARKPHKCSECRTTIKAGEKYRYSTGKSDGDFYALKFCRRCEYDCIRIVEHELAEGCSWSEAWPPMGGGNMIEYLEDSMLSQTPIADVPATFQIGDRPRRPNRVPVTA